MPGEIHGVVQNAHDLDFSGLRGAKQDEVPSPPVLAGDMKAHQVRGDVVAAPNAGLVWSGFKRCERLDQGPAIGLGLAGAEPLEAPVQDVGEVPFGRG